MIKAIETEYKDYLFRSRLEARWAVFFDAIGVTWEYEKEGYDFDGLWYLPDFWVWEWDSFAEIKGYTEQLEDGLFKCRKLKEMTGKRSFVLYGAPDYEIYQMIFPDVEHDGELYYGIENPNKILQCRKCSSFWFSNTREISYGPINRCDPKCTSEKGPFLTDVLINAHNNAKSYRF